MIPHLTEDACSCIKFIEVIKMETESEAVLLRIFIGESDKHEGKSLYKHILELCRKEGVAGATVIRGVDGFGKTSHIPTLTVVTHF